MFAIGRGVRLILRRNVHDASEIGVLTTQILDIKKHPLRC